MANWALPKTGKPCVADPKAPIEQKGVDSSISVGVNWTQDLARLRLKPASHVLQPAELVVDSKS